MKVADKNLNHIFIQNTGLESLKWRKQEAKSISLNYIIVLKSKKLSLWAIFSLYCNLDIHGKCYIFSPRTLSFASFPLLREIHVLSVLPQCCCVSLRASCHLVSPAWHLSGSYLVCVWQGLSSLKLSTIEACQYIKLLAYEICFVKLSMGIGIAIAKPATHDSSKLQRWQTTSIAKHCSRSFEHLWDYKNARNLNWWMGLVRYAFAVLTFLYSRSFMV